MPEGEWYAVRCVFEVSRIGGSHTYEKRITLWLAESDEEAIERAESAALQYAADGDDAYLGLAQSFRLFATPTDGSEVFSLMRDSDLSPRAYIGQFFDTGDERQGRLEG
jgi:hypothetical protein